MKNLLITLVAFAFVLTLSISSFGAGAKKVDVDKEFALYEGREIDALDPGVNLDYGVSFEKYEDPGESPGTQKLFIDQFQYPSDPQSVSLIYCLLIKTDNRGPPDNKIAFRKARDRLN